MNVKNISYGILILSILSRIFLFTLNNYSNDNHIEPILLWLENGVYPSSDQCWECFQPPGLYFIIKSIASIFNVSDYSTVLNIFLAVNLLISLVWTLIVYNFLRLKFVPNRTQVAFMAFWLLNPKILAIGAQATNDMAIILVGTLFIQQISRWMNNRVDLFPIIWAGLLACLGTLVKGNGLILLALFYFSMVIFCFQSVGLKKKLTAIFASIAFGCLAFGMGGYYSKYLEYDNPFKNNQTMAPKPNWSSFDSSYQGRFGVKTIKDAFFTFDIIGLIKEPFIESEGRYPIHRESYFTQLYGQFNHALFERHPYEWISKNNDMLNFARSNYLLTFPIFMLFLGNFILLFIRMIVEIFGKKLVKEEHFHVLTLLAFLSFGIYYAIQYRDFSNMKVIFLFPAVLSIITITGRNTFHRNTSKVIHTLLFSSVLLNLINIGYLMVTLLKIQP